jgi:hypothetical protein
MALQRGEHPAALARPVAQDLRHRKLGVIIQDRLRDAAKKAKAATCPSQKASATSAG